MNDKVNNISSKVFKYRSYTPIPFLVLMLVFAEPNIVSMITGFLLALIGEGIRFWGVSWAGSETRTTSNVGGSYLIVSGPFGYVRNPLYVGNILMYLGIGIMSMSLFPYLQIGAIIFFIIQYNLIVQEEEKYLRKEFAEGYKIYCENVPRFLPSFVQYKNTGFQQPERNSKAGLKSEARTLQAFAIVSILILGIWMVKNL